MGSSESLGLNEDVDHSAHRVNAVAKAMATVAPARPFEEMEGKLGVGGVVKNVVEDCNDEGGSQLLGVSLDGR